MSWKARLVVFPLNGNPKSRLFNRYERGAALIEFMFTSLIWLPLLLGTTVFGINLIRAIQVSQLARDSGHMYAYGIDFSQSQNAALLQRLAAALNIQQTGGEGAIVLSKITLVTNSDCVAANLKVCPNNGKYVFTSVVVFGNQTYASTKLGSLSSKYYTSGANLQAAQYLTDPSLVATGFPSPPIVFPADQPGQYAFVSEVNLSSGLSNVTGYSTGSYARSIF